MVDGVYFDESTSVDELSVTNEPIGTEGFNICGPTLRSFIIIPKNAKTNDSLSMVQ